MSIKKKQTIGLAIGFAYGACLIPPVPAAHGGEEPDALIAQIRQKHDEVQAAFAALNNAKEKLKQRVLEGDTAAADACARVLDELRVKPGKWWDLLPSSERMSIQDQQTALIHALITDESGFLSYAERAFDDPNTQARFKKHLLNPWSYRFRATSDSIRERVSRLLMRAAKSEDIDLHRHALKIMSGLRWGSISGTAWDVDAAIPLIREYAEGWTADPLHKSWFPEALVALNADGHERYIREFEEFVQDSNNDIALRVKFAKNLLRWGRIDRAALAVLKKALAESLRPKMKKSTWKNGKLIVETIYLDDPKYLQDTQTE